MAAGKALARYHRAVQDLKCDWKPSATTFHDNSAVRRGLNSIPTTTAGHDSVIGHEAELLSIVQELHERYDEQAEAANKNGVSSFYQTVIHGDWHPGNMLFRGRKVAVVLDFDAAKAAPAVIDLANGMLQFSIIRGRGDPSEWPAFFDESRMRRFFMGYVSRADLSPEQVARMLNEYFEAITSAVFENQGFLDKFVGDELMAVFGVPLEQDDHAERAARCALGIKRGLAALNQRRAARGEGPLDCGVGIHTGQVAAGHIGTAERANYTVVGDTVNVAARIEGLTSGGEVLISEEVQQRLDGSLATRAWKTVQLRGSDREHRLFELTGGER